LRRDCHTRSPLRLRYTETRRSVDWVTTTLSPNPGAPMGERPVFSSQSGINVSGNDSPEDGARLASPM